MALQKLTPVPFSRVRLDDAFWAPRVSTNRLVTIPAEYRMCRDTGRIASFDLQWHEGDDNPPHLFWDAQVAKWVEAASYTLANYPDPRLDELVDLLIAKMARAQLPDGYLNTHFQQVEPGKRFTNLRDCHELYCAGHLIEAAVAHHQATGKRTLLDVACRYADLIDATLGGADGKRRGYDGHEEVELALVRLYHATGEQRYLNLALYFVDERGQKPYYFDLEAQARGEDPAGFWAHTYAYMQAHIPVREQTEVTGHAVRAMYLYSAMTDLANEMGDASLFKACERLWDDLCLGRLYVTGGIGSSASNEGFTLSYDLPDETAYAETCAAVGLIFWSHRMLQSGGDGRYADVMERALYNGALSGVSLDGRSFFYTNPLASRGDQHRKGWFDVACCPPNIARLIASLGGYVYSQGGHDAWVHLYVQSEGRLQVGASALTLRQITRYPWDGDVRLTVQPDAPCSFTLHLRVPGWCECYELWVNGIPVTGAPVEQGYLTLEREWRAGDVVRLSMAMPVRYVQANPAVRQALGRLALQRGPVVYCVEGCDHLGVALDRILLRPNGPAEHELSPEARPDLLGGVVVLRGKVDLGSQGSWDGVLYRPWVSPSEHIELLAVPYYAWDNRLPGGMRVWLRTI